MTFKEFIFKVIRTLVRISTYAFFQYPRVLKYKLLSSCQRVKGRSIKYQPVQINGKGVVEFSSSVRFGVNQSPFLYSGYIYIDARKKNSKISFAEDVWVNNNCTFISEGSGIEIGKYSLIGANTAIYDSDFHNLDPHKRRGGRSETEGVKIGQNVLIGSNVTILKGVTIGNNTVIGAGSVVTKTIPPNVIAAGNPARVLRNI